MRGKIKKACIVSFVLIAVFLFVSMSIQDGNESEVMEEDNKTTGMNYLMSSNDFTNQQWSRRDVYRFFRSWKRNKFTKRDVKLICESCREFRVHPLVVAAKLEQENSLVKNITKSHHNYETRKFRGMAYGLRKKKYVNGKKYYVHGGFEKQIYRGTRCLRKWFDVWKHGKSHPINFGEKRVFPKNAATYSLSKVSLYNARHYVSSHYIYQIIQKQIGRGQI